MDKYYTNAEYNATFDRCFIHKIVITLQHLE